MLHISLFLAVFFSGGRQDGVNKEDTPITQVVMIESPQAMRREGPADGHLKPAVLTPAQRVRDRVDLVQPATLPVAEPQAEPQPIAEADEAISVAGMEIQAPAPAVIAEESEENPQPTVVMPQAQASALLQRIERLAKKALGAQSRATVSWTQDGKRYDAELVLERATNGSELDRVIADVSAEDRGRRLWARVMLKQLSFSHFAQIIDRWDPTVQLHDDEIVGPTHFNSEFKVLDDARAKPALLGKVSTTASSVNLQSSERGAEAAVFRQGIETGAGRITLRDQVRPAEWALKDTNARIHHFVHDTRLRFFADGSYWWRDAKSDQTKYTRDVPGHPVYFVADRGATLFVQGVISGKVLIYSPDRIVVEGSLTCAHDPRRDPESGDFLGLVSGRDVELASPAVTGPGDIEIQGAVFAKRRFLVTDLDHAPTSTLRVYGSLAAGTISASEPRYATVIEYDRRFEEERPPGFPAVNRYVAEDWDGQWQESPVSATAGVYNPGQLSH